MVLLVQLPREPTVPKYLPLHNKLTRFTPLNFPVPPADDQLDPSLCISFSCFRRMPVQRGDGITIVPLVSSVPVNSLGESVDVAEQILANIHIPPRAPLVKASLLAVADVTHSV